MTTFTYTAEEMDHLRQQCEVAFLYAADPSGLDPAYYEHLAHCAVDAVQCRELGILPSSWEMAEADEMLEIAEALRCGMNLHGGEDLI